MIHNSAISELIYRSSLSLNDLDFDGYLKLCDPEFRYTVTAYSPEIKKDMTWLDYDKKGMETLFFTLDKHNSLRDSIIRHITVCTIDRNEDSQQACLVSTFQVYRTTQDGGVTALFAIGAYHDVVAVDGEKPRLLSRNVRLETRELGIGSHVPF